MTTDQKPMAVMLAGVVAAALVAGIVLWVGSQETQRTKFPPGTLQTAELPALHPASPGKKLFPPATPPTIRPNLIRKGMRDPFAPQPKPQWMIDKEIEDTKAGEAARIARYTYYVPIVEIPPIRPTEGFHFPPPPPPPPFPAAYTGRLVGWIYNHNGQAVAIFEDIDGTSHIVQVDDSIGERTVRAIGRDYLVLVDAQGNEEMITRREASASARIE